MSDPRFEHDLHRMFGEAPPRPDADFFAARVRERLDRAWTLRRVLIGLAGAFSGVIALWQLAGSQAMVQVEQVLKTPVSGLWRENRLVADLAPVLKALPLPPEVVWLTGGLMLLAAGMLVTRVVDEL